MIEVVARVGDKELVLPINPWLPHGEGTNQGTVEVVINAIAMAMTGKLIAEIKSSIFRSQVLETIELR
ncbi:MAG: hypothetical protein JWM21_719 [Acidobacteria bacterium]|nr:hypothetical protein [Acidobacteriota bacterium]